MPTLGLGLMPVGFGPAGGGLASLAIGRPSASVAWKIDPATQSYVLAPDGNVAGMDGTDQRVLLAVVGATIDLDIITPDALERQRAATTTALAVMGPTPGGDGSIGDIAVTVVDDGSQTVVQTVDYFNNGTSKAETITLT